MALNINPIRRGNILRGLLSPHALELVISNDADDADPLDLTTVTDASIEVTDERTGATATWTPSIEAGATADQLTLVFIFHATTSEIPTPTVKCLVVELTTPDGVRVAGPARLYID